MHTLVFIWHSFLLHVFFICLFNPLLVPGFPMISCLECVVIYVSSTFGYMYSHTSTKALRSSCFPFIVFLPRLSVRHRPQPSLPCLQPGKRDANRNTVSPIVIALRYGLFSCAITSRMEIFRSRKSPQIDGSPQNVSDDAHLFVSSAVVVEMALFEEKVCTRCGNKGCCG